MLAIKLEPQDEIRLAQLAKDLGRVTNDVVRDWVLARMDREDVDAKIRNFASLDAEERCRIAEIAGGDATDAWLRALDAEDGGYDWGPGGPPIEG